jgi:hypothetical protein
VTPAVVDVLIDRYANDEPSIAAQAHAALLRLNGGENLGTPAAWRSWAKNR